MMMKGLLLFDLKWVVGGLTFLGSIPTHCPPTLSSCGTRYDITIPPSPHPGSVDNRTMMEE